MMGHPDGSIRMPASSPKARRRPCGTDVRSLICTRIGESVGISSLIKTNGGIQRIYKCDVDGISVWLRGTLSGMLSRVPASLHSSQHAYSCRTASQSKPALRLSTG
jgi:hypothetical protein